MTIDKRTFVIIAIIVVIALPIIIFTFHKSFFPIIASVGHTLQSASLSNGATGLPPDLLPENVRRAIGK